MARWVLVAAVLAGLAGCTLVKGPTESGLPTYYGSVQR